ncbi:MAG TPA: ABC transporter permease [Candidatus Acidoferrales bacterium]|nr:ABC transporter permease [Candidatus Acidoferrales bacterium]
MFSDLLFRLRSLFRSRAVEAELDDELRFHRDRQLEKYLQSGLARDEALRRVRLEFGGLDQVKEDCRDARGVRPLETFLQDLRYALRTLRKSPGFTAVALFTLALGIGANTAIFSVVYGVLIQPLPFRDPAGLVVLNETTPRVGTVSVSYPNFLDWRAQSRTFSAMAAVYGLHFNLAGASRPENIGALAVSPDFFSITGVRPVLGRVFTASEEKPGAAPVLLLTHALWQSHFGGDPGILGRAVTLDSRVFTVAGVLPPDFRWTDRIDVVEPIGVWATGNDDATRREERGDMVVLGRLAPGANFARARSEMEAIAARLAREYPAANDQCGVTLQLLRDAFVGDIRPAILVLLGAVTFVLFVACANVANLFLMRAAGRTREIALRIAIGAGRGRIVAQLLAESFVVALLGTLAGLALAAAGIAGLARLIPMDSLAGAAIGLNPAVLLFSAAVMVLSMFLFGLAPAIHSSRAGLSAGLNDGSRGASAGAGQHRSRAVLAAAEVSLALVLLVGAGLMVKSLHRLLAVDPGFRPERVLKLEFALRTASYEKDPAILAFWQQLLDRVRVLPGVESAALGTAIPLTDNHWRTDIAVEGAPLPQPGSFPHPDVHIVSPAYIGTLRLRLFAGREFTDADNQTAPRVALINTMTAQRLYPGADPVGKRFCLGRPSPSHPPKWITIVGVVGDTRLYGLANPSRMEIYFPHRQIVSGEMSLLVRSALDPASLASSVRAAAASIDRDQPIFAVATMNQVVEASVSTRRVTLILLGLFGALALVLAAIGIYGVISYSVAQRSREIGIRVALGAQRADVLRLVLFQGARIAGAGILTGIVGSLALTRLMARLLFSVSAADPPTYAGVAVALAVVALLACYIPARRTLRVDPVTALRHE